MSEEVLSDGGAIQNALLGVANNPLSLLPARTVERAVLLGLETQFEAQFEARVEAGLPQGLQRLPQRRSPVRY